MTPRLLSTQAALALAAVCALGQGTPVFDQQSADETLVPEQAAGIQANAPIGQSFTPSLSGVGFIRLSFLDPNPGNGLGATVLLNLRADSITGPVLGSTTPVFMPDGFGSTAFVVTNFFFPTQVAITPGTMYYFDITVQSGDQWMLRRYIPTGNYPGGTEYLLGQPGNNDLWFREGILVPEPAPSVLLLLGAGAVAAALRRIPLTLHREKAKP